MKYFILIVITFSATLTKNSSGKSYLVVWNVGQGQFISSITPLYCDHFDMGGEFFPWKKILFQCQEKENRAFLSHWDWDHIGALNKLKRKSFSKNFCIALRPLGTSSKYKMNLLAFFPSCSLEKFPGQTWQPKSAKNSNALSQIIKYQNTLIPGDSPAQQEKIWSQVPWIKDTRVLILGHHGSKTSTSKLLLNSLPNLKMSISSARWRRYHHPHANVEARLHEFKISLLRTEDWGNIWIEQ